MFQNAHTHVMQNEHIIQRICIKMKMIQETFHTMINVSNICFYSLPSIPRAPTLQRYTFQHLCGGKTTQTVVEKLHRIYNNVNLHFTLNASLQSLLYSDRIYLLGLSFFTLEIYFYILKM